jgi:hypothetical protein
MALRMLDRTEWRAFCDRVSKGLVGKRAEIEVVSLALGSQVEAEWLPLLGLAYDPKSDIVEVALDGLDHLVEHPQELAADVIAGGLVTVEIVDSEGVRQIIKLRDPLMLPRASWPAA